MRNLFSFILAVFGIAFLSPNAFAATITTTTDVSAFSARMVRSTDIHFSELPYGPRSGLFSGARFSLLANRTQHLDGLNSVLGETGVVVGADAQDLGYPVPSGRGDNVMEVIDGKLVSDYRPSQLTSHLTVGFVTVDANGNVALQSVSRLGIRVVTSGDAHVSFFGSDGSRLARVEVVGSGFFGFSSDAPFAFVVLQFTVEGDAALTELFFDGNGLGALPATSSPTTSVPGAEQGGRTSPPVILLGANAGEAPRVTLLSTDGSIQSRFLAYDEFFTGGVSVGMGDLDGDRKYEIVTAPGRGRAPEIRIFDLDGTYRQHFFAFSRKFRNGVNIAVGDLDGNGKAEIVVAPKRGGGPQVRIFGKRGARFRPTTEHFFAYRPSFRGGVSVTLGDLDADGKAEIMTAPESSGGPHVRVFSSKLGIFRPSTGGVMAYARSFTSGIRLAAGDLDADGKVEIVTIPRPDTDSRLRVFRMTARGLQRAQTDVAAYSSTEASGAFVTVSDVNDDGKYEIVIVDPSRERPIVRTLRFQN